MAKSAIIVNEGRTALISYLRNSAYSSQSNQFYLKEFRLLNGVSGVTDANKDWDLSEDANDLSQYLITDGDFAISNRTAETGNILRLHLTIPSEYTTSGTDIEGVAIIAENESAEEFLFGWATFTGFNKVAGLDITLYFDVQF